MTVAAMSARTRHLLARSETARAAYSRLGNSPGTPGDADPAKWRSFWRRTLANAERRAVLASDMRRAVEVAGEELGRALWNRDPHDVPNAELDLLEDLQEEWRRHWLTAVTTAQDVRGHR